MSDAQPPDPVSPSGLDPQANKPTNTRRWVILVVTNVLSLAALVWTLRDVDLSDLTSDYRSINWWWVAAASVAELSVYLCQAVRWKLILAPVANLRFGQIARAIYIGMFASEALPVRAGEVLRCYLVSRWARAKGQDLGISVALASVVIERVFDGLLMWVGLKLTLVGIPLPRRFQVGVDGLGGFVLLSVVLLAIALFLNKPKGVPAMNGFRKKIWILREDLSRIGHSWRLGGALLQSIPYMVMQAVPIYILFQQYQFELTFMNAIALMLLLRVISAVPGTPATLGWFQVVTREFLELGFGIPGNTAARYSLLMWAVVKLPVIAAGFLALSVTGAKIGELTEAAQEETSSAHAMRGA